MRKLLDRLGGLYNEGGRALFSVLSMLGLATLGGLLFVAPAGAEPTGTAALTAEGEEQVGTFVDIITGPMGLALIGLAVAAVVLGIVLRMVKKSRSNAS